MRRRRLLILAPFALVACAPLPPRESVQRTTAQANREAVLAPRTHWSLHGRIAVADGHEGGSGELVWHQDGSCYELLVRAPVTGRSWRLVGGSAGAVLEGVDAEPLHGADGAALLRDRLGWDVPLARLAAWVRGLRAADAPATLTEDMRGRPQRLTQAGWTVEYRAWFDDDEPPLPRKLEASRGTTHVRLIIDQWTFDG